MAQRSDLFSRLVWQRTPMFLRRTVRKTDLLMPLSLTPVLFFSFLHLVMLSIRPSLEKEQHLRRLSTLLVLVNSQTFSSVFLCVTLCGLSFSLSALAETPK